MRHPKKAPIKQVKIKRTLTMAATIREGADFLSHLDPISYFKNRSTTRLSAAGVTKPISKTPRTRKTKKAPTKKTNVGGSTLPLTGSIAPLTSSPSIFSSFLPLANAFNPPPVPVNNTAPVNLPPKTSSRIGLPGGPVAGMIDVVFCCDTTSSMSSYLAKTKDVVKQLIEKIRNKVVGETVDVKFGFVCYRDHPPQDSSYVIKTKELCDEKEILDFIFKQEAQGGGDFPEAVMDGLWEAASNIKWRNPLGTPTLRYIIHIADAPPHGDEYCPGGSSSWKDGCPCGLKIDKIAHVINSREIHYRLVKIGISLEKMTQIFRGQILNYMDLPLEEAGSLDIKVSDMIIRELLPEEIMV